MNEEPQSQEFINDMIILPCPICNKRPKIKRDYNYESSVFGAYCTIQCKPLLKQLHLKVECGKRTWERAYKYAIQDWNISVRKMLE